jgi:hypothetical protein
LCALDRVSGRHRSGFGRLLRNGWYGSEDGCRI